MWYSKRQSTVETSTFGSEIVATKTAIEMVEGLRYKLRMLGVPIDGPCRLFCDNDSVVKNITRAESPLRKKHCSISYHKARETIAASIICVAKEAGSNKVIARTEASRFKWVCYVVKLISCIILV